MSVSISVLCLKHAVLCCAMLSCAQVQGACWSAQGDHAAPAAQDRTHHQDTQPLIIDPVSQHRQQRQQEQQWQQQVQELALVRLDQHSQDLQRSCYSSDFGGSGVASVCVAVGCVFCGAVAVFVFASITQHMLAATTPVLLLVLRASAVSQVAYGRFVAAVCGSGRV